MESYARSAEQSAVTRDLGDSQATVSIRDDEKYRKHVKKQGHSISRSAESTVSLWLEGHSPGEVAVIEDEAEQTRRGVGFTSGIDSSSNSQKISSMVPKRLSSDADEEMPKHARKQGHHASLSIANLFNESQHSQNGESDKDISPMDDNGHGCHVTNGGQEKEHDINIVEMQARDSAESRRFVLFFWNGFSSALVFARYLISIDSILSLTLSCGLTYWSWVHTKDEESFDGSMSFILLGFAVLMPLSVSVRIVFSRREKALDNVASLQTHAQHIYLCHACWDWGKAPGGRSEDPERWIKHSDEVLRILIAIGDELTRFLTLPNSSFSRHRETVAGRREAAVTIGASYRLFGDIIDNRVTRLATLLEELKLAGFSASEASRVRQYERNLTQAAHNLRMLKMYRSPKALHALLNLATTLLPPFYAPGFAQIAHDTGSLGLGIAFAAITSLALSALYESVQVLEDPFVAFLTLDGIDVYEELAVLYYHQLIETRRRIFPEAHLFNEADDELYKDDEDNESSPTLDRRSMMLSLKKSQSGSRRLGSLRSLEGKRKGGNRRRSSLMRRQSVFDMDLSLGT